MFKLVMTILVLRERLAVVLTPQQRVLAGLLIKHMASLIATIYFHMMTSFILVALLASESVSKHAALGRCGYMQVLSVATTLRNGKPRCGWSAAINCGSQVRVVEP